MMGYIGYGLYSKWDDIEMLRTYLIVSLIVIFVNVVVRAVRKK
jgi:hypothetical protein